MRETYAYSNRYLQNLGNMTSVKIQCSNCKILFQSFFYAAHRLIWFDCCFLLGTLCPSRHLCLSMIYPFWMTLAICLGYIKENGCEEKKGEVYWLLNMNFSSICLGKFSPPKSPNLTNQNKVVKGERCLDPELP